MYFTIYTRFSQQAQISFDYDLEAELAHLATSKRALPVFYGLSASDSLIAFVYHESSQSSIIFIVAPALLALTNNNDAGFFRNANVF